MYTPHWHSGREFGFVTPKRTRKEAKELNSFIKPAHSNLDITFDQILTNQNWATQTMNVLIKHYANCLKDHFGHVI